MKKLIKITALTLCLSIFVGCGNANVDVLNTEEIALTNVEIENPTQRTMKDEYMYSGKIAASKSVDVTGKVAGIVASTNAEVGDYVSAGQILYSIDDVDIRNSIKTAQTSVNTAQAGVQSAQTGVATANGATMQSQLEGAKNAITNAETGVENSKKAVEDAEVAIQNAQMAFDRAKDEYEISKQLFNVGGIPEDTLNTVFNAYEQATNGLTMAKNSKVKAELGVKNAENAYEQAKKTYEILSTQTMSENSRRANDALNSARAGKASAEAALNSAKQQLAYCKVKSPISGTVLTKNVNKGSMSGGIAYTIVDLSSVDVEVNVSEMIATSLTIGTVVNINVPSLSNLKFSGAVTEIPPGANQDGTYKIKVNIPNDDGQLKSGMFAEVYFAKSTSDNAVVVPRNSVIKEGEESFVYVVDNDVATKKVVEIGIDAGDYIEIKSGINTNMKVVTKGQTYLADGDKVFIVADNGVESELPKMETTKDSEEDKKSKGE